VAAKLVEGLVELGFHAWDIDSESASRPLCGFWRVDDQ
jgi:hypothetical protein